jgi:hypothetical protein
MRASIIRSVIGRYSVLPASRRPESGDTVMMMPERFAGLVASAVLALTLSACQKAPDPTSATEAKR